ncbi:MAG: RNA methyltransferase [Byssovorax sp.]
MRRTSPHCAYIAREQQKLLGELRGLDRAGIDAILATLLPFITPERTARIEQVFARRLRAVTVLMDAPHDPHNGAAVIRSCDAFGVHSLHVVERVEGFLVSNTVARGSERWVEVLTYPTSDEGIRALQRGGYELVATHPEGELSPEDLPSIPRLCLVLGNEKTGIHASLRPACKRGVRVPMRGFAESLNVSVTAAILLQHATHGRPGDFTEDEQAMLRARALVLSIPHAPEILAAKGITLSTP